MIKQEEILKVEHLVKSYDKKEPVLKDLSFTLNKGEVVVIVGPSGCGKSTFLRCLNMLEPINSGTLHFKEQVISRDEKDVHEIRQKIGMVFQSYDLFPHKNIIGNILLAPLKVQKRSKKEVEVLFIKKFICLFVFHRLKLFSKYYRLIIRSLDGIS